MSKIPPADALRPMFIGIDVGGTNIKLGLVDDAGRTAAQSSIPTEDEKGCEDAVCRMSEAARKLTDGAGVAWDEVAAVGLATPGSMDVPAGLILDPANLPGWRHYPIRDELAKACGKSVTFANDANAAAFGEYWVGSGNAYPSMVLLTLGTGVGGGIIVDGLSIDGEHSHGSECGHIIIDYHEDARMCPCGHRGHLEAYASATAVVARACEALEAGRQSSIGARADAGEEVTPLIVCEEADRGDALACELVEETARYLGIGIVSLMHTIDPGAVILGGAMDFGGNATPTGRGFIERVRQEVRDRAFAVVAKHTVIEYATLGGDAGYIGSAGIARESWKKNGASK